MKRRLILHLGLWKTGTTAIQSFLRGHPERLAAAGAYYPRVRPDNPDHPFFDPPPATAYLADEVSHRFLAQELAAKPLPTGEPVLWPTAFRGFDESGADTAIVSYEDLSAQVEKYDFGRIAAQLKAYDVTGLIYLRPQESWAVSLYSHFLRAGRTSVPFAEFVANMRPRLAYSALLDRIVANIPLDRLLVRDFDEAAKAGLIADFVSALDLPSEIAAAAEGRGPRNRSQPIWALLFGLACAWANLPPSPLGVVRKALNRFSRSADAPSFRPGLDLASPAERAGLRAIMAEDAPRLAERYGFGFGDPVQRDEAYRPFDAEDFDMVRAALSPHLPSPVRLVLGVLQPRFAG